MQNIVKGMNTVFLRQPRYLFLACFIAFCIITAVLWYQNWSLIVTLLSFSHTTLLLKLKFLLSLYGGIFTNFSFFGAVMLVAIALLFGVQSALLTFYMRRVQRVFRTSSWRTHGAGGVALFAGAFGIGCAACGSLVATAILTSLGAGGFLLLLPLHGAEFGLVSVGILLLSVYYLLQKIASPLTCPT